MGPAVRRAAAGRAASLPRAGRVPAPGDGDPGRLGLPHSVGVGEFGTYYAAYSATPSVTERMLERMFIGDPPGNYDRILDFSTAVTGNLFFAPSADFLDDLPGPPPAV